MGCGCVGTAAPAAVGLAASAVYRKTALRGIGVGVCTWNRCRGTWTAGADVARFCKPAKVGNVGNIRWSFLYRHEFKRSLLLETKNNRRAACGSWLRAFLSQSTSSTSLVMAAALRLRVVVPAAAAFFRPPPVAALLLDRAALANGSRCKFAFQSGSYNSSACFHTQGGQH
ncbi:Hypothetical protein UVM_LOCUS363 [uncultured virus]|nr:Hypothetical protein UVM_LOCUS363 [uncultured virus]